MRSLTVEAISEASALALFSALSEFSPMLNGNEQGGYRVVVPVKGPGRQVGALLNAIERFLSSRRAGGAQVELDGRTYTLEPATRSRGAAPEISPVPFDIAERKGES